MYDTNKTPELVLKIGVTNALVNGKKIKINSAPLIKDAQILIPVCVLPEQATVSETVTLEGAEYAPLSQIGNIAVKFDTMGIILIDKDDDIKNIDRSSDLNYLLSLANKFIYDLNGSIEWSPNKYAPATEEERKVFKSVGADAVKLLKAHSTAHPYLFADREKFATLRRFYRSEDSTDIKGYIETTLKRADKIFNDEKYAMNEDQSGLAKPIENTCTFGGYDVGGRHSCAEGHVSSMMQLAFAYQITEDEKYAKTAYYIGLDVGSFEHWGPGHFLNCANAASMMATAYDWLYDAWKDLGLDTGVIKKFIFTNGILQGFNSAIYDSCDFPSERQGTGWRFKAKPDNWNAVCNGGLLIANLALLSEQPDGYVDASGLAQAEELLGANLVSLTGDGLVMKQYAPDGSYVESAGYWAYGTNTLFRAIGALYSALGTDLGLHNAPGLDKTCYYAMHSESSDFVRWSYHDGGLGSQDTSMFNLFAAVSEDTTLSAIRTSQLKRGKDVTVYDLLFHPDVLGTELPELDGIGLDYYMEGIDALTVRSGWEAGALYAGIIGGYNPKGGSHNHVDSGAFVYHNKGILWFTDLGGDNYNITGGYFGNYKLYKRNAEGHNVIFLKSLPYGQALDTTGAVESVSLGSSSHIVINNKAVYGDANTVYGKRGMLYCNDRKTVVIQDEIKFLQPEEVYFATHYKSSEIKAEISPSGRKVTLTHKDGESITLRALGTEGRFEITGCYDFILPETASFEGEQSREEYSRLIMKFDQITELNFAIVIDGDDECGYTEIIPTADWNK